MVHEAFKIFRKICLHFKNQAEDGLGGAVGKAQKTEVPKPDVASKESDQNTGVGELVEAESGFAVGSAPQDARPDGYTVGQIAPKPIQKAVKERRFHTEEKALDYFKTSSEGKELNEEYEKLREQMKEKKAAVREISQRVNKCKYKIDELSLKLEKSRRQRNIPTCE